MASAAGAPTAPERVSVFGEVLISDRPLPGLPAADPGDGLSSFWALQTETSPEPIAFAPGSRPCGTLPYSNGVAVRLAHGADGTAQLLIDDTGRFTLDGDAQRIAHCAPPAVDRDAVALDLIGVILPYALHARGAWCLHASAVALGDRVVAFVAESGTGKSTLAAACVAAGATLVSDDVVVTHRIGAGVAVQPAGVPIRLHAATARALGEDNALAPDAWGKVRVAAATERRRLPLEAVYVVQAMTADAPLSRIRRGARAATMALLAHGKLTALLGAALADEALARCTALAATVPVYDLAMPRDLSQLASAAATLMAWHHEAHACEAVAP
jgi:hypothetical protein